MTVSTITVLSAAVNAAFNLTIDGQRVKDIIENAAKPAQYEFGLFADQDIRACQSMYYTLIFQLVNLMRADDKPLQDRAKEGSLDANDTGRADENELAREEAIDDVLHGIAYLQRHLRSLDERARKELEEAGQRTADGGRVRFGLKNRVYKSMIKDVEEVLIDMKTREPVSNTRRLAQIDMALDLNIPHVSETDAAQAFMDYMDPVRLDRGSQRAAEAVIDTLTELGQLVEMHNSQMSQLNAERQEAMALRNPQDRKIATDSVMSRMALCRNEHRQNTNYPMWMLKQRLAPIALLQHTGALSQLIDTPEWRAAEAHERAQAAKAKAQEVQASMMEMEAMMAEQEANMQLLVLRQQQMEMQKRMAAQQAEFEAMFAPKKTKAPKAEKPSAVLTEGKLEAEVKAEKPKVINSGMRHLSNMPSYSRPRG